MGWGAAMAFYQENSSWLDGPEDAYEALYGNDSEKRERNHRKKHACPLCGRRYKTKKSLIQHLTDFHKPAKAEPYLAKLRDDEPEEPSKVGPLFNKGGKP